MYKNVSPPTFALVEDSVLRLRRAIAYIHNTLSLQVRGQSG